MSEEQKKGFPGGFLQTEFSADENASATTVLVLPWGKPVSWRSSCNWCRVCKKVQLISVLLTFPGQCLDFFPEAKWLLT